MVGVKVALSSGGITVVAEWQCAKDRKEWRVFLHTKMIEFH